MVQKTLNAVVAILLLAIMEYSCVSAKSLTGLDSPEEQPDYSVQQVGSWKGDGDLMSHPMWKYLPEDGWENPQDPKMYLLRENGETEQSPSPPMSRNIRKKRLGPSNGGKAPSLSIVNPLDVLRERLLLEIARRRIQQSTSQIHHNEQLLRKIGKRSVREMEAPMYTKRMGNQVPSAFHS